MTSARVARAAEPARGMARVANEVIENGEAASFVCFVAEALFRTERQRGDTPGLVRRHAEPEVLLRFHFQMKAEFVVLVGRDAGSRELLARAAKEGEHRQVSALSTRVTAPTKRFQLASSWPSARRPAVVSE